MLRFEGSVLCQDKQRREYSVLLYSESQTGKRHAYLEEAFRRRRLAILKDGASFRILDEGTVIRPVTNRPP